MREILRSRGVIFIGVVVLSACRSNNREKEIAGYHYEAVDTGLNGQLKTKVGTWIEEGAVCYGILVLPNENGLPKKMKEMKARVVLLAHDQIKMKSMEDIVLAPVEGCSKMGIRKGETWWEKEGELFQTREEAIAFIDTNYPGLRATD